MDRNLKSLTRLFCILLLVLKLIESSLHGQLNKFQKTDFNTAAKKGEFIFYITKNYCPNAYEILIKTGQENFIKWSEGRSHYLVLSSLATVVHESCHVVNFNASGFWSYGFFIAPGIEIKTDKTDVFRTSEIDKIIPDEQKDRIFRYSTYISEKTGNEDISSIKDGIYGLMDEFDAYYQSTRALIESFEYYKTIAKNSDTYYWNLYISNCYSTIYAYYEFRLFIAWYLKYAKEKYPKIYQDIINNKNLKVVFTFIDQNYEKVVDQYFTNRQIIIETINKSGVEKVEIKGNYFYIKPVKEKGNATGYGIPDNEIKYLKSLFTETDYRVLKALTIENLNEKNYKDFLD
ncbi:MAG: hypothetical protein U0W24_02630 [Bacteroidales bacterium]